jgi:hypothetical protein
VKKKLSLSKMQKMGGKARAAKLSGARRKQIASDAAKARAAKLSPERRKEIALAGARARFPKGRR